MEKVNERLFLSRSCQAGVELIGLMDDNPEGNCSRLSGAVIGSVSETRARIVGESPYALALSNQTLSPDPLSLLFGATLTGFAQFRFIEKPEPKSPPNADYSVRKAGSLDSSDRGDNVRLFSRGIRVFSLEEMFCLFFRGGTRDSRKLELFDLNLYR